MIATKQQSTNILNEHRIVYCGYETVDAATSVAIDELLLQRASSEKRVFVRFYDFTSPVILLSDVDDPVIIKKENLDGMQVVRRESHGEVMLINSKRQLSYSVVGPLKKPIYEGVPVRGIHAEIGNLVAKAIVATTGIEPGRVTVGEDYSVRVDGGVIAGHAQNAKYRASALQGFIAVDEWDTAEISSHLDLVGEDYNVYQIFPVLKGLSRDSKNEGMSVAAFKKKFIASFLALLPRVSERLTETERTEITDRSLAMREHYTSQEWIYRKDVRLDRSTRLCPRWSG